MTCTIFMMMMMIIHQFRRVCPSFLSCAACLSSSCVMTPARGSRRSRRRWSSSCAVVVVVVERGNSPDDADIAIAVIVLAPFVLIDKQSAFHVFIPGCRRLGRLLYISVSRKCVLPGQPLNMHILPFGNDTARLHVTDRYASPFITFNPNLQSRE